MKKSIIQLWYYSKKYLKNEVIGLIFTILYSLSIYFSTIVSQYLIDEVIPGDSIKKLYQGIIIFFLGCIGQPVFGYIKNIIFINISERMTCDLRINMFNRVIDTPMTFFEKNKLGSIVSRIANDGSSISDYTTNLFVVLIKNILLIAIILTGMFRMSYQLTLMVVALFMFYFIANWIIAKGINIISRKIQECYDEICNLVQYNFKIIDTLKMFNFQNKVKEDFKKCVEKACKWNIKYAQKRMLLNAINNSLVVLSLTIIYGFGAYMVMNEILTIGTIVAFGLFYQNLAQPISEFLSSNIDIKRIEPIIDRIDEYTNLVKEDNFFGNRTISTIKTIEFNNLNFTCNKNNILKNININLNDKGLYAIVGTSGSGKSTIVKLIKGFYGSYSGMIKINGILLEEYGISYIREKVSVVSQEVNLLNDTITKNISMKESLTEVEINKIIDYVNLTELLKCSEDGINTVISERVNISGGEKQRLGIARAMAKKSDVYIFDEPTSSLDSLNENIIKNLIQKLSMDSIVIIITHNYNLLHEAKEIFVIEDGWIRESGSFSELNNKEKYFYKLITELNKEERVITNERNF